MEGESDGMKIGFFAEGCYPYLVGGVSSWAHQLIRYFDDITFNLQTIVATKAEFGQFRYELPKNIATVSESALGDTFVAKKRRYKRLTKPQKKALTELIVGGEADWDALFALFDTPGLSIPGLLMSQDFYQIALALYEKSFRQTVFTDFLWTVRSMYSPLFHVLSVPVLEADVYHSASTGYAGVLAVKAARKYGRPLVITEHGIYTREREEEIIKADWTHGVYKDMWIEFFYKLSHCCYRYSARVVSLFQGARMLQVEIGCPKEKTMVIPNGIRAELYQDLPRKAPDDPDIHVGSVLRITPIKDVKTMLIAFSFAKEKKKNLRLWLLGPTEEDPTYYEECLELAKALGVGDDVTFTGRINVREYLGKLDIFILTSISEGQPISMLEAMAARVPSIATRVGNCEGLLAGEQDEFGPCGLVVPVMNASRTSEALLRLAESESLRETYGQAGRKRVFAHYTETMFLQQYRALYEQLAKEG